MTIEHTQIDRTEVVQLTGGRGLKGEQGDTGPVGPVGPEGPLGDPATIAANPAFTSRYMPLVNRARINAVREVVARSYDPPPLYDIPVVTSVALGGEGAFIASGSWFTATRVGGVATAAPDVDAETKWKYHGLTTEMMSASGVLPQYYVIANWKPGGAASAAGWPFYIEFETNSAKVLVSESTPVANPALDAVVVNGRRAVGSTARIAAAGGGLYTGLTFPDARPRRIGYWVCGTSQRFQGLYMPTAQPPTRPKYPSVRKVAVIGDSFVNGASGATNLETFAWRVADNLGADEIILGGIGGTRWAQASSGTADQLTSHFGGGRLNTILTMNPDVIVFVGSINDGSSTDAEIRAGVALALGKCAAVPEVYVVGSVKAGFDAMNTSVKTATLTAGRRFVDCNNLIYGTGKVGTPTGDGNADFYITTDGVHPSFDGHQFLAGKIVQAILAGKTMT